jgi:gallate dioxygenase
VKEGKADRGFPAGQSLEDFQKTRNAPNALYSVAGKSAREPSWQ